MTQLCWDELKRNTTRLLWDGVSNKFVFQGLQASDNYSINKISKYGVFPPSRLS